MSLQLKKTSFYEDWLSFTGNRSVAECDFFDLKEDPVAELLGDFSTERLIAFGEHASGSVLAFYSKSIESPVDEVPVAWLDSEGAPCIVISNNLKEFLSILPYGMGFVYSVASVIENNLGDPATLTKARERILKDATGLLEEAKKRFLNIEDLINWLGTKSIPVSDDPVKLIVDAHDKNSDLTPWIAENLT